MQELEGRLFSLNVQHLLLSLWFLLTKALVSAEDCILSATAGGGTSADLSQVGGATLNTMSDDVNDDDDVEG